MMQNYRFLLRNLFLLISIILMNEVPNSVGQSLEYPLNTGTSAPQYTTSAESKLSCPEGTVLTDGKCRKIICPFGEYYNGRCLEPACPEGLVWRGRRCQSPAYITTILEIDNVFTSKVRQSQPKIIPENVNNIYYHTPKPEIEITKKMSTTAAYDIETITTEKPRTTMRTTRKSINPGLVNETDCCTVITPRICKQYTSTWLCFHHRRSKICDPKVCKYPVMYLKAPKTTLTHTNNTHILIMPPNPPLEACRTPNCDSSNVVDCSGCAENRRETCSPFCYQYTCLKGFCGFMDMHDYCELYPGEFGCIAEHGCIWDWCGEKCNT
ncbi:uncharacterized protein LOC119684251 [Teleopsis dalmanni]|uniref:uncharacterized protein LOC119684251 n=1 Tax=Teleopsis dalmanni TaxID=139649 RepID=UPI0018CED973|nr:uncharacterized protein LOC119684251 [Teleopsis dalmanni]